MSLFPGDSSQAELMMMVLVRSERSVALGHHTFFRTIGATQPENHVQKAWAQTVQSSRVCGSMASLCATNARRIIFVEQQSKTRRNKVHYKWMTRLGMLARVQDLATLLTPEALPVPVKAHRLAPFGCKRTMERKLVRLFRKGKIDGDLGSIFQIKTNLPKYTGLPHLRQDLIVGPRLRKY